MTSPPYKVHTAIEEGRSSSNRRIEFYESDGATRWYPAGTSEPTSRLASGTVTIDYGRAERYGLDLVLDNVDGKLRPNSAGGLWYDKIIKVYRGVTYATDTRPPRIAVIEEDDTNQGYAIQAILSNLGFSRTDVLTRASSVSEVADYDIVVSYMRTEKTAKSALLQACYAQGISVLTIGSKSTETEVPLITSTTSVDWTPGIAQVSEDTPVNSGWTTETYTPLTAASGTRQIATLTAGVRRVAVKSPGSTIPTAAIYENSNGTRWFHSQNQGFGTQGKILLRNAVNWLWNYSPTSTWETQVGEFMIDNIASQNFPHTVKVSGRDYAKKMLLSKLTSPTSFAAGTNIETLVGAVAANAGVMRTQLPITGVSLPDRMDFDSGTDRWTIASKAAESAQYELFFDPRGYLTMRKFIDPAYGSISKTFQTGVNGNLVKWNRSLNDSRLYNHVVVRSDSSGSEGTLPYFGEAKNTEASSPTRIARLGDRTYFYSSSFFTSDDQCASYALSLLKVTALESYEISWSSIAFPWLGVGEVIEFVDPDAGVLDPTRFLMDTINLPLAPGPMSATGKRVTFVNDPSIVG